MGNFLVQDSQIIWLHEEQEFLCNQFSNVLRIKHEINFAYLRALPSVLNHRVKNFEWSKTFYFEGQKTSTTSDGLFPNDEAKKRKRKKIKAENICGLFPLLCSSSYSHITFHVLRMLAEAWVRSPMNKVVCLRPRVYDVEMKLIKVDPDFISGIQGKWFLNCAEGPSGN